MLFIIKYKKHNEPSPVYEALGFTEVDLLLKSFEWLLGLLRLELV